MIAPTYGLHLDSDCNVMSAKDFTHSYQCNDWLRSLDIEPGDRIEFKALHVRADFEEVPEAPPVAPPPSIAPAMLDDPVL